MKINKTLLALFFGVISFSPTLWANKWVEATKNGDIISLNFHLLVHGEAKALKHVARMRDTAVAHGQIEVLAWLDETFSALPNPGHTTWEDLGFDTTEYREPLPFRVVSPIPQDPYALELSDDMDMDDELEQLPLDYYSATDSSF